MRRFINKKRAVAVLIGLTAVAITAVAVAFWTGTGTGTGEATVGESGAVALTGTVAEGIAPGTAEPVAFTAANPSESPVQVGTVHLVAVAVDGAHATCEVADFSMVDVAENHQVPAEATVEPLPNAGSLVYANTCVSQDTCKGATLTLTLTSN
jgi:hypothetical protein